MPYSAVVLVLVLVLVVALLQSPLLSAPRGNALIRFENEECPKSQIESLGHLSR